jgi:uncharacterized protein
MAHYETNQPRLGGTGGVKEPGGQGGGYGPGVPTGGGAGQGGVTLPPQPTNGKDRAKTFFDAADIPAAAAKTRLVELAEEIVTLLAKDPNADVRLTVEMRADFPEGVAEDVRRAVSENAKALKLKTAEWE